MGNNFVRIENKTNYTWTYCYSYLGSEDVIRGSDVLVPWGNKNDPQSALVSNLYIKYGNQSQHDCRYYADLVRDYNGIHNPTFQIREINADRSEIELSCLEGGGRPRCPNYGKQSEDRLLQDQREAERKRREEEERRRREQEQKRKAEEEDKRQRERVEREKRIQEEISRENQVLNEKLTQTSERFGALQRGLESHQRQAYILHYSVEDDAAGIQTDEIKDIEKKFDQLLREHEIQEDEGVASAAIKERIETLQNELQAHYCLTMGWPMWSLSGLQEALDQGTLSLTEQLSLLEATIQVTLKDSGLEMIHSLEAITPIEEKYSCYLRVIDILFRDNKTLAAKLSGILFPELSNDAKDYVIQIIFSGIWTPSQAFLVIHHPTASNISTDEMVKLLHIVLTYQIPIIRTISALEKEEPLKDLQKHILGEKDKDLQAILLEMRAKKYPEKIILILQNVLEKVKSRLPDSEPYPDLSDEMKAEGVKMIQSMDFSKPDPEKLASILVGLSIAVQDKTTTVASTGEKIEGYFPRMTQLAALLTLLLSEQLGQKGCLLEIATGEGKSCIVAMLAIILAIRGRKVDIVTSSPVLARRDEEEWCALYKMFGLTHSIVPPKGLDKFTDSRDRDNALKGAYTKNIVYGTVGNFAADILRQEFEKEETRGDRKFDIVIVDEVDYLTLDSGVQVTFLSHASMGMRHLEQLLAAVWAKVCTCKQIENAKTKEILWVARIQPFHDAAASAVMGSARSEHFSPYDILKPGLQLGFYSEEDLKQFDSDVEGSGESNESELKAILKNLGPSQQRDLLTIFEGVLEDAVVFQCYQVENDRAVEFESNVQLDTAEKINLLLLDEGHASEIMSEGDLIAETVHDLMNKIKFSDRYELPSSKDENAEAFLLIPAYLEEYVKNRLPVFVENALKAILMVKDREYMIDSISSSADTGVGNAAPNNHLHDCIVPVDFKSTGVLEKNKRWGDGLQQFLEMKHQLALSPLSNVTNFMSNFHFFQRYVQGAGIFGVSGTLGDKAETKFLLKNFKTSCYEVPTHRHTKKIELPIIQVEGGRKHWIQRICDRVKDITSPKPWAKGHATLVVCEDIKTAEELRMELIEHEAVHGADKITLYTRSDKHSVENKEFDSGEVIIATNLGGRGTDIKISRDVNDSGGLFVILTHFPSNMRVEKQIFGRTARKGNPGMVQMIINQQDLVVAYQGQPIETMRKLRADYEKSRIDDMENDELLEVTTREALFGEFCRLLQDFDSKYEKDEKVNVYKTRDLTRLWREWRPKMDYRPALNALKETWALWLTMHSKDIDDHVNVQTLKDNLREVIEGRSQALVEGKSNNFYDFIRQGMDRMYLHTQDKKNDYGTLSYWDNAITTDKVFSAVSLYNKAYITVNLGRGDYKQEAKDLLVKSNEAIKVYISELKYTMIPCQMSTTANFEPHCKEHPNLTKQMETRYSLVNAWMGYIDKSIKKLEELQENNVDAITKDEVVFDLSDEKDPIISSELVALYDQGLGIVFEVERKPRFCIDALICAIVGLCQILVGALVCVLTLGTASQIGMGLISEGISDLFSGVEGMITNKFSWVDWAVSKAISFGVSLLTAGFSALKHVVKSVSKATRDVLKGVKSFASVADDIITSGKRVVSSATHAVKSSLSKQSLSNSLGKLSSKSAMKNNCLQVAKYVGKEISMKAIQKGMVYGIDRALEATIKEIFKDVLRNRIFKALQQNEQINTTLKLFVVVNGVPETALQAETPSAYKIPMPNRGKMKEIVGQVSSCVATDVTHHETFNVAFQCIEQMKDPVLKVMEAANVSGAFQTGFKLSFECANLIAACTKCLLSVPFLDLVNNGIIPLMTEKLNVSTGNKETALAEDTRCSFPDVQEMTSELRDIVQNRLSDDLLELFTEHFISSLHGAVRMVHTAAKDKIGRLTAKAMDSITGRLPTPHWFLDQTPKLAMEVMKPEEGSLQPKLIPTALGSCVMAIVETLRLSTELQIRILAKSPLLHGKGIKVIVKDETGREISTEHFEGRESATGDITLHLTQAKATIASDTYALGNKVQDSLADSKSAFSGRFDLVWPDGSIHPTDSGSQDSLYHALAQAQGNVPEADVSQQAQELRSKVQREVSENLNIYEELMKRQADYDRVYLGPGKYTVGGRIKRGKTYQYETAGTRETVTNNEARIESKIKDGIKKLDSKEQAMICAYNLGVAAEHSRMSNACFGYERSRYLVEVTPIPPEAALKEAAERTVSSQNPMLSQHVTDQRGRGMMAISVLYEHNQTALTTGAESEKTRVLIAGELSQNNNERALKLSMIAANPLTSGLLRDDAGLDTPAISLSAAWSISSEGTQAYYQRGFYMLVKAYHDINILDSTEYESLLSWIGNESYLRKDTKEYETILGSIKHTDE